MTVQVDVSRNAGITPNRTHIFKGGVVAIRSPVVRSAALHFSDMPIPKFLMNSDQPPVSGRRCSMRNHDFVSDGSLALIVTALVLLCSSWLVLAFS